MICCRVYWWKIRKYGNIWCSYGKNLNHPVARIDNKRFTVHVTVVVSCKNAKRSEIFCVLGVMVSPAWNKFVKQLSGGTIQNSDLTYLMLQSAKMLLYTFPDELCAVRVVTAILLWSIQSCPHYGSIDCLILWLELILLRLYSRVRATFSNGSDASFCKCMFVCAWHLFSFYQRFMAECALVDMSRY